MAVKGGGANTKSCFIVRTVRINQNLVKKKSEKFIDSYVWEPCFILSSMNEI